MESRKLRHLGHRSRWLLPCVTNTGYPTKRRRCGMEENAPVTLLVESMVLCHAIDRNSQGRLGDGSPKFPKHLSAVILDSVTKHDRLEKRSNAAALVTCYLNNRVFLSRNYRLIVAPRKFDVLKTNICPRSEASRANMLVLRTSNFQGATIRPIVPRHKHSIVFIVHY